MCKIKTRHHFVEENIIMIIIKLLQNLKTKLTTALLKQSDALNDTIVIAIIK